MPAAAPYGRSRDAAPIRLMLVDDSIVARSVFQAIVGPCPDMVIEAVASSADQALARLDAAEVDVVVLDLAMPGMDGLTALPEIIRRGRGARVLVVSASAGAGADACVRALTLGAADTLEKPAAGGFNEAFRVGFIDKLRRVAAEAPKPERAIAPSSVPVAPLALQAEVAGAVDCVAIGSSTGGLHALSAFFAALPLSVDVPVLVTQHLPASFMSYFARQISALAGRPAAVARDGDPLRPGQIMVAPGDAHLCVAGAGKRTRVSLNRLRAPSGCLPSVDPMLISVAERFGAAGVGVILSGMGRDGLIGARALVAAGGEVGAQDQASSVVWGMPGSVAGAGLASIVAAPALLAARVADRVRQHATKAPPQP